jgi:hypothetical protein
MGQQGPRLRRLPRVGRRVPPAGRDGEPGGASELGWKDFAATPDEVAKVRAAMLGRDNLPAIHQNGTSE